MLKDAICYLDCKDLIQKKLKMYGFILSTMATDALVQTHKVISTLSADSTFITFYQFHAAILHLERINDRKNNNFENDSPLV